jgi:hypothetical protein
MRWYRFPISAISFQDPSFGFGRIRKEGQDVDRIKDAPQLRSFYEISQAGQRIVLFPLDKITIGDQDHVFLREAFSGIVILFKIRHFRGFMGVMDLEDPLQFRVPGLGCLPIIEEGQPLQDPVSDTTRDLQGRPGKIRFGIIRDTDVITECCSVQVPILQNL